MSRGRRDAPQSLLSALPPSGQAGWEAAQKKASGFLKTLVSVFIKTTYNLPHFYYTLFTFIVYIKPGRQTLESHLSEDIGHLVVVVAALLLHILSMIFTPY